MDRSQKWTDESKLSSHFHPFPHCQLIQSQWYYCRSAHVVFGLGAEAP